MALRIWFLTSSAYLLYSDCDSKGHCFQEQKRCCWEGEGLEDRRWWFEWVLIPSLMLNHYKTWNWSTRTGGRQIEYSFSLYASIEFNDSLRLLNPPPSPSLAKWYFLLLLSSWKIQVWLMKLHYRKACLCEQPFVSSVGWGYNIIT